ncbi:phage tail protein [Mergibacter septicus]|uniref:phage tail protein n=1 Tax=Mergibacter septicus TaxID=221402 RepID=UPI001C78DCB1|nr:phage tail protein [Mergibacter septicus]QDJ13082.1 phage tail protein [Mergibacter septicus]
MKKPNQIRQVLTDSLTYLQHNPDQLLIFIENGKIITTNAKSLSFEYRYTLNIILTDFHSDLATVIAPLIGYLKIHQPELLQNPDRREHFQFESDFINHDTQDVSIKLELTEKVISEYRENNLILTYGDEPLTLEKLRAEYYAE